MKFGITTFPTEYTIPVTELGRAVEDLGFESLFFPEHTHIPVSRRSQYPGGGELGREYSHALDPFVALAAVAAVTTRIRLGTGISLLVERDPITAAKEVASLDHLSGGRTLYGVGGGWNHEEMENHGTKPSLRWKILRERVLAMKAIWTQDEAEFHGQFVDFDPIWSWPKPVQEPHPPVLMGGYGPRTFERIVDYCEGWFPIPAWTPRPLEEMVPELQAMAKAAGRGPVSVSVFAPPPKQDVLERFAEAGIERSVFIIPPVGTEDALSCLRRYADLVRSFGM